MESAKPVRPIAAGKDADADAQVPGGLVGGGGHPSPFGRGHPDEQGVERRVQRPERKSLHKSYANVGTHGQLRIALRQSADEGQAGVARSDQEQAANDEPAGAATVRPFARKEARDAEPDGHGRVVDAAVEGDGHLLGVQGYVGRGHAVGDGGKQQREGFPYPPAQNQVSERELAALGQAAVGHFHRAGRSEACQAYQEQGDEQHVVGHPWYCFSPVHKVIKRFGSSDKCVGRTYKKCGPGQWVAVRSLVWHCGP